MNKKHTNESIDKLLFERNIKRLHNYINSCTKIQFQCLLKKCNFIWEARPGNILTGNGCPKCAGNMKYTIDYIDLKLKNRNIQILDSYQGMHFSINWKCLICNNIWLATPNGVIGNKSGCPKCAIKIITEKQKFTNQEIDQFLIKRNIKKIDDYINFATKINFQCLSDNCDHIWKTTPAHIISNKSGCPKCSKRIKRTNKEIDDFFSKQKIKRLNNYVNGSTPILCECLVCGRQWRGIPRNMFNRGDGCPDCNKTGRNEHLIKSILKNNYFNFNHDYCINRINTLENKRYLVDFYLPDYNLIIEYNGEQHYYPVCFGGISLDRAKENFIKQKARDKYVEEFCKINNINILWIDGRKFKFKKLENYMNNLITSKFKIIDENCAFDIDTKLYHKTNINNIIIMRDK